MDQWLSRLPPPGHHRFGFLSRPASQAWQVRTTARLQRSNNFRKSNQNSWVIINLHTQTVQQLLQLVAYELYPQEYRPHSRDRLHLRRWLHDRLSFKFAHRMVPDQNGNNQSVCAHDHDPPSHLHTQVCETHTSSLCSSLYFSNGRWTNQKPLEEIRNWEHPPWYGIDQFKRVILTFLENQKGLFHLTTHFRMPVKQ